MKKITHRQITVVILMQVVYAAALSAACGSEPQPVRFTDTVTPLGGKNLVPNGSFEIGSAGWSSLGVCSGTTGSRRRTKLDSTATTFIS